MIYGKHPLEIPIFLMEKFVFCHILFPAICTFHLAVYLIQIPLLQFFASSFFGQDFS